MPYIKQAHREDIGMKTDHLDPMSSGDLNYLFTRIGLNYIENHGESYQAYNDIIGALEGAKLELYRRRVAPYEDQKREANGDVF